MFPFFLVAAPLKMVQAPKRVPFFSRVTKSLRRKDDAIRARDKKCHSPAHIAEQLRDGPSNNFACVFLSRADGFEAGGSISLLCEL